jgi:thiol:disulfide interchange protein DsbA
MFLHMAKKQSRFLVQQKIAVAVFALFAVAVVGYLTMLMFEDAPLGEFVEGEHYQLIDNPRRIRSDKVEVMEFFSYACVHCYNFDPDLTDWVEEQGEKVNFIRMPAVASDYWRLLGRNYYAMEQLGITDNQHMAFFRAVHDAQQVFNSVGKLRSYYDSRGVDPDEYEAAFKSTEVTGQISRADQMARRLKVASVPTIVIQGKYEIRTTASIGPKRMLEVMDYLVKKEMAAAAEPEQPAG